MRSKKFHIQYNATLQSSSATDIRVWLSKPQSFLTQTIGSFSISQKIKNQYEDIHKNTVLYFDFKNQKNIDIALDLRATLAQIKIDFTKKISLPSASLKEFRQYTQNENLLEQTAEIKKLTRRITQDAQSVLDKIFSITEFLRKNFKYVCPVKKRGVKNLNLHNLGGDCGEVGALFVTMCRILGIPAINQTGFVIYHDELNNIYEHGWTTIYLKPYGWIDIDPLAENIIFKNGKYKYENKNYFLSFTKGFNIKLQPRIPKTFTYSFWHKLGLPMTNGSVQILQPLVFASRNKITFSDNIKLVSEIKSPN